ncbi:ABC transporter permease [Marinomonas sp. 2405UD68-3]|uniref:ABC transporter permease n=1 Tax=Marinomonas sp. 2405UD68-3 TaxID=3391835 RepID=UPI0039C915AE
MSVPQLSELKDQDVNGSVIDKLSQRIKHKGVPVETFVVLLTALLWVMLAFASPYFLTEGNILNIMRQVSISGIIAFGVLFTILIAGIDLSVGSVAALAGVVVAKLLVLGLPIWLAVAGALGLGIVIGFFNAFAIFRLGIPAFIVTLAGLQAYRGGALLVSDGMSVSGLPRAFSAFARGEFLGIPTLFWTMAIIGLILHFVLTKTRTGRYLIAMGSNQESASRVGINISKMTFIAYTLSAGLAALAGILLVSRLSVGTPTAAMAYELNAIAAAVVGGASLFGGRGSIVGTFIGALLFVTIANGANLLGVDPFWQMVAAGVLIAIVVYIDNVQKRRKLGV